MPATYDTRVDWSGNSDFTGTGENVSGRVLSTPMEISYGRDQARALSPLASGRASFDLSNLSRDYSPENLSSPIAGLVLPARPVRIQATLNSTVYTLFRGHLDDFDLRPQRGDQSVSVTCLDGLAKLKGVKISTALHQGIQTGQAIGLILDAVGWPALDRDIDPGATTIRWWWEEDADAFDALVKIVDAEGPTAFVFMGVDNKIVFRDRHHRLIRAESTGSQATFRDAGGDTRFSWPLLYDHGWRDIINHITIDVAEREPSPDLTAVFQDTGIRFIADGQTLDVDARSNDPFIRAVSPQSGVDYEIRSGAVSVSLSRISGQSATISITASGGPARIENLQLRAYPVPVARTYKIVVEDSASITKYGKRSYPRDVSWAGVHDADAIAELLLGRYAERLPIVTVTLKSGNDQIQTQQLTRDLSDRVSIVDAETGLDADFFIEQIRHFFTGAGERVHTTTFGCEKSPTLEADTFILGTSLLNTGTLGSVGVDNPTKIFKLNTSLLNTGQLAR